MYDFIARVKGECPPVDILVNNGGVILRKPPADHPDEYWDRVIEIDLNAQWVLSREFARDMVERKSGKIIFTASLLSFQGGITVPGYAAAKGGIAQLTILKPCARMPLGTPRSWHAFPLANGAQPKTSPAPWSTSLPPPQTT